MSKRIALMFGAAMIVGATGLQAYADDGPGRHRWQNRLRVQEKWDRAHMGLLYLVEKDPSTWEVVEGGAWGKLHYTKSGPSFRFVFNGHGMTPEADYTLIYYPDPWPGYDLICLGSGTADEDGYVHIMNSVETGDLPAEYDENFEVGAKIWLVLSSDVSCDAPQMQLWNPTEYLFENELIFFVSTAWPGGPHAHGPRDRTRIAMGLYERLEGDPEDVRGSGELYGCVNVESEQEGLLSLRTKLRYAVPDTTFDVYAKVGEDHDSAQGNPLFMGEMCTDDTGEAVASWVIDISMFAAPELYVQVVVVPVEPSSTLGYASDTRPVLLVSE